MRKFLCILSILFCAPAWAGVVYNWETIDSAGYTADTLGTALSLTGRMEIDNAAWLSGSVNHVNTPVCPPWSCAPGDLSDPSSPILRFAFDGQPHYGGALDLHYRTGAGAVFVAVGEFSLSLAALATGSIYADSGETTMMMASSGSLWTISYFDSDAGPFCYRDGQGASTRCAGVTGLWVLDLSTIPRRVPEPATVALLALGFALAGALRRRR